MFRKPSKRVHTPKPPAHRYDELARAQKIVEVRFRHPELFRQPE